MKQPACMCVKLYKIYMKCIYLYRLDNGRGLDDLIDH